jgi:hypothetical protein
MRRFQMIFETQKALFAVKAFKSAEQTRMTENREITAPRTARCFIGTPS